MGYGSGGSGGGVGGATGATDNAIIRADGTGGSTLQGSSVLIDDSGNLTMTGGRLLPSTGNDLTLQNPAAGGNKVVIQNAFLEQGLTFDDTRRLRAPGILTTPGLTPSQITANQNNYAGGDISSTVWRISSDAARDITGIAPPTFSGSGSVFQEGELRLLINVGSNNITLKHQDALSTAANRFLNSTGADIVLSANQGADLYYDNTTARWRVFKRT